MKKLTVLLAALAFAAMTGFGGCTTTPKNPQEAVYAAQGTFNAALSVAIAYKKLPVCMPDNGPLCSDPATVELLQHSATAADAALKAARKAVCTVETLKDGKRVCKSSFEGGAVDKALAAMKLALEAFKSVTDSLRVK